MKLVEVVDQVLKTGVMPMAVERRMYELMARNEFDPTEVAAIEQLLEALTNGSIQAIA